MELFFADRTSQFVATLERGAGMSLSSWFTLMLDVVEM
jgi:hypothetical protein